MAKDEDNHDLLLCVTIRRIELNEFRQKTCSNDYLVVVRCLQPICKKDNELSGKISLLESQKLWILILSSFLAPDQRFERAAEYQQAQKCQSGRDKHFD